VTLENIPFLHRNTTIEALWNSYKSFAAESPGEKPGGFQRVGRPTFYDIVAAITRGVEESACLSYYFTDFLDGIKALKDIVTRIQEIWEPEANANLRPELDTLGYAANDLLEWVDSGLRHGKYSMFRHIETDPEACTGCAMHCAAFATNAPCRSAVHQASCTECAAFVRLPMVADEFRRAVIKALEREHPNDARFDVRNAKGPIYELTSMFQALGYVQSTLYLYMQHVVHRGVAMHAN